MLYREHRAYGPAAFLSAYICRWSRYVLWNLVSVVVGSFVIVQSSKVWLPTSVFLPQRHSFSAGFHPSASRRSCAHVQALNGFGLHIVADRAVTLSGTSLGFGGRLRLSPIAVGRVCHIQLFTTGTLLPVISIIIFPCFIVNIVRMNRNRLFLRIFADGAGAFSGTCFGCGGSFVIVQSPKVWLATVS